MEFSININITPSASFVGILADLNGVYKGWSDGSYDWANQTSDFLSDLPPLPNFDQSLFETELSKRLLNEVMQITLAMIRGDYQFIRNFLKGVRFVFIIGYPRTGGSYLTKAILNVVGVDHKHIPEPLAHDSFPNVMDSWYDLETQRPLSYFYESFIQMAEFLVLSKAYFQIKLTNKKFYGMPVVKKIHKAAHAGFGFKMLFNPGQADYLLTVRNPLPIAISVYEKSGGLPADGLFPAKKQRSAIEVMIMHDLLMEGYSMDEIARLDYYKAVEKSWVRFYSKMAISGLFSMNKQGVRVVPYSKEALQGTVRIYQDRYKTPGKIEDFHIHEKADQYQDHKKQSADAVLKMETYWASLGLTFPKLNFS